MTENQVLYVRRCHICGNVSEQIGERVEHCSACGKSMSQFYFFDDRTVQSYSDMPDPIRDLASGCQAALPTHEFKEDSGWAMRGFSAVWEWGPIVPIPWQMCS
jgi:hypothetical protein